MRINTNVASLNSQRVLGQTGKAVERGIGRLSSGFRINRAGDDAAGLGIANKLRADVRALKQASRNAEQANSLLQVAEGAAQTVSAIVDRMKELSVQAASDSVNAEGRALIDAEFQELKAEITRIVDTTKFQGAKLLDATISNKVDTNAANSTVLGAANAVQRVAISGVGAGTYTIINNADSTFTLSDSAGSLTQTVDLTGKTGKQMVSFDKFGISFETTTAFDASDAAHLGGALGATGDIVVDGTGNTTFMVSVSGQQGGADDVTLGSVDLKLATLGLSTSNLLDKAAAQAVIQAIDDTALAAISDAFGSIGAAQNRLEYATQNVKTTIENFAAAESTIRDADMAAEMAEFTKNQILQQAGVAMLAQANAAPQLVLRLLQ